MPSQPSILMLAALLAAPSWPLTAKDFWSLLGDSGPLDSNYQNELSRQFPPRFAFPGDPGHWLGQLISRGMLHGVKPYPLASQAKAVWTLANVHPERQTGILVDLAEAGFSTRLDAARLDAAWLVAASLGGDSLSDADFQLLFYSLETGWPESCIEAIPSWIRQSGLDGFEGEAGRLRTLVTLDSMARHEARCMEASHTPKKTSPAQLPMDSLEWASLELGASSLLISELRAEVEELSQLPESYPLVLKAMVHGLHLGLRPWKLARGFAIALEEKGNTSAEELEAALGKAVDFVKEEPGERERVEILQALDWVRKRLQKLRDPAAGIEDHRVDARLLQNSIKEFLQSGTPYHYGGTTPRGVDCSGLVWYVFQEQGLRFPRVSRLQFAWLDARGYLLPSGEPPRYGDLVFFSTYPSHRGGRITHVGIHTGDNRFVHSARGKGVYLSSLNEPYFRDRLAGIGRVGYGVRQAEQ